jgi:hypothetical protein
VEDQPVWRRVLIPATYPLDGVHRVIQGAMGWQDYHLHVFRAGELAYGPDPEGELGFLDETKVRLADVADAGECIGYEYDFSDGWEHELAIEARTESEAGQTYPACTGGEGACPPEDSGGLAGYAISGRVRPAYGCGRSWYTADHLVSVGAQAPPGSRRQLRLQTGG